MPGKPDILPVYRSREAAGPAYDKMSGWYDILTGPSEKRYRKAGLKMLDARPGERILEIGCGTGHAAVAIAKATGSSGKLCAFDLSPKMLKKTHERLVKAGLADHSETIQGDAFDLPFTDDIFDALFMSFTLELFDIPDITVILKQCYRVLRIGGRLVVVAMNKGEKPGNMLLLYEWMHKKFPNMVDCRPIHSTKFISDAGFKVACTRKMSLAGIPIEVVKAEKV